MNKIILLFWACALACSAKSQNIFTTITRDSKTLEPIAGVSVVVQNGDAGTATDSNGICTLTNIPNGKKLIRYSHTGYEPALVNHIFPLLQTDTVEILLESLEPELDEVVIQSTRTGRTIKNTPTRIETIDGEELDEKNNMRPANVSMLLHESTGLQVQQTSATSGNASIRVQGLDGRYTQLLKDGYPNFGNFASGLSLLEIPPLDLQQVEVIKGPASTLYSGGAIAGVINFISKMPKDQPETELLFNQSNIGQTNIGAYTAHKKGKFGYTILGLVNFQKAYDVDKDDFSEVPKSDNFTIHPRLFFYPNESTRLMLGNSFTRGSNTGGDMDVINGKNIAGHTYFEKNTTIRNTTTFELDKKFAGRNSLKIKQSLAIFDRHISVPDYSFAGTSINAFTDISLVFFKANHIFIGGLNFIYDRFRQEGSSAQDTRTSTGGIYLQDTWDITKMIKIESGLRVDQVAFQNNQYSRNQAFVLPRFSVLFRLSDKISSRIGGGLGYKMPSIFTEQTERLQYRDILPLSNTSAEKSVGGTADINYSSKISADLLLGFNQLFFYTRINTPLVLKANSNGQYYFGNASKPVTSHGFETNLKLTFKEVLKLVAGYTFTDAKATYLTQQQFLPLLPKNKLNLTLMYEKEDNFKLGLEGYLTGAQYLYNGTKTPAFWEFGFMAQKTFEKISVFVNFENFTDQRQGKYKPVVNPPYNNPSFDDIWNHLEGFTMNGGVKVKL